MGRHARLLSFVVIVAALVSACGDGNDGAIANQDPAMIQAGSVAYAASCASCHGTSLRGTDKGPSLLSEVYEPSHHADIAFLLAAQRGVSAHHWSFGDMPAIETVSSEEIETIVAFVRETQRIEGFERYPP